MALVNAVHVIVRIAEAANWRRLLLNDHRCVSIVGDWLEGGLLLLLIDCTCTAVPNQTNIGTSGRSTAHTQSLKMLAARRSYRCRILISFRGKLLLHSRLLTADDIHVTPAGRLDDHSATGDNWRDDHITALLN